MKAHYYLFGCLALAACDEATQLETAGPVVVNFSQPFPAHLPDLPGFLPRDRGRYAVPGDTGRVVVLEERALVNNYFTLADVAGKQLEALHIGPHASSGLASSRLRYQVQAIGPDSFRLRLETRDTLLNFSGLRAPHLRYYKGYYYTSTPSYQDSAKWTVRRLAVANGHLTQQLFNPDSLRVRALDPTIVQQKRRRGQLILTLSPQSRRAIGQVSSYAGLWLDLPTADPTEATAE
jgi:hypothetical protein